MKLSGNAGRAVWLAVLALAVAVTVTAPLAINARYSASATGGPIAVPIAEWEAEAQEGAWGSPAAVPTKTILLRRGSADYALGALIGITEDNSGSAVAARYAYTPVNSGALDITYTNADRAPGASAPGVNLSFALKNNYNAAAAAGCYADVSLNFNWTATQVD